MNYKTSKEIPTEILCKKVEELVVKLKSIGSFDPIYFHKSIPENPEQDADLILAELVRRLREHEGLYEFKQGDLVLVSDDMKDWRIAFYIRKEATRGYPYKASQHCIIDYAYAPNWKYCKPYRPEE